MKRREEGPLHIAAAAAFWLLAGTTLVRSFVEFVVICFRALFIHR